MPAQRLERVLTLRLPALAARQLSARARSLGTTPSALVRELLAREFLSADAEVPLVERTRRFVGAISDARLPKGRDAREVLDAWEPNRRG